MENKKILSSFFIGGFECSTHRLSSGKRLDEIAFTQHDRFALKDYQRLNDQGMYVSREGIRWHLIEKEPGIYDFSNELPLIRAAKATNSQVIWDLCHYGWPAWLDIFEPRFIDSVEKMSRAFA